MPHDIFLYTVELYTKYITLFIAFCILLFLTFSYLYLFILSPPPTHFISHHLPLPSQLPYSRLHLLILLHPQDNLSIQELTKQLLSCFFFFFFFLTLTRQTDTIDRPTGQRRSFIATKRISKQMDFRG